MACLKNLRTDLNPSADTLGKWFWNLASPITVDITGLGATALTQNDEIAAGNDDPELDFHSIVGLAAGTYVNAFKYQGGTGNCAATAYLDLVINAAPNAGGNNSINLCTNDPSRIIFNDLSGTPQNTGTFANDDADGGYNANGAGPTDDSFDPAGIPRTVHFTYTVSDASADCPCVDATAIVTYIISEAFDAGAGGTIETCA